MKKIIDYDLITTIGLRALISETNRYLAEGWQPYGRPFHTQDQFYQAMVKYEDSKV